MISIAPGTICRLPDGRILVAHRDDDSDGIAFLTPSPGREFVLRASHTGGRGCLALVERYWPPGAPLSSPEYAPTDFTEADLTVLSRDRRHR